LSRPFCKYACAPSSAGAQSLSRCGNIHSWAVVALGGMPSEAVHTDEFLDRVDSLFDFFNSGNFGTTKLLRKPLTAREKQWDFLKECKELLASIKVANSKMTLPCVQGFIMNINSLIGLFEELSQTYGFKFLLTD